MNKISKNNKGFTIVEVMIVLAVAGLILAVVFVAVPALQRNQRNGARRSDVAYLRSQFEQATANAGNKLPSATAFSGILNVEELNYMGAGVTETATSSERIALTAMNASNAAACNIIPGFTADTSYSSTSSCQHSDGNNITHSDHSGVTAAADVGKWACQEMNGSIAGTNCDDVAVIIMHDASNYSASANITLSDQANSVLIVTNAKCKTDSKASHTVDIGIYGAPNYTGDVIPAPASTVTAWWYTLEGDGNSYCQDNA